MSVRAYPSRETRVLVAFKRPTCGIAFLPVCARQLAENPSAGMGRLDQPRRCQWSIEFWRFNRPTFPARRDAP